ncbi:MAG: hypothetical protein KAR01_00725, partial [Desulfocapsa sp.]|nr:hypothetical protein [Desulfocapsa sp.]
MMQQFRFYDTCQVSAVIFYQCVDTVTAFTGRISHQIEKILPSMVKVVMWWGQVLKYNVFVYNIVTFSSGMLLDELSPG